MTRESSGGEEKRRPGYIYDPAAPLPEHLRPKPAAEPVKSRLRDFDSSDNVYRLKAVTYSLVGIVIGAGTGLWYSLLTGRPLLPYLIGFAVVMWAIVFFGTLFFVDRAASIGASVYFHRGASTPGHREYSFAESLAARGRYEQAAEEYENNAAQYTDDPEPLLRLARLQRDALRQPEAAAASFQRALAASGIEPGLEVLTRRELIELYLHHMKDARRALPELEHLAARVRRTADVEWARRELAELQRTLAGEQRDRHA